jgi:AcrR family transcriptional regulator
VKNEKYMKISELSKYSGISISKIRYYISKKLLPQPIKISRTSAFYTRQHVERLRIITELQAGKKLSIATIQKLISSITQTDADEKLRELRPSQIVRDQIINASVEVFRKKGYERATITDITKAAEISRNTFYQNFQDKRELFIACLTNLFLEWRRDAPDRKTPIHSLIKKMALAHYRVYPRWSDMMNMFRAAATKYPNEFADKLQDALDLRIRPIAEDIERSMRQAEIRKVDAELAAIILAGQLDYICYFLTRGKFGDREPLDVIDQMLDIFFNGIKKDASSNLQAN